MKPIWHLSETETLALVPANPPLLDRKVHRRHGIGGDQKLRLSGFYAWAVRCLLEGEQSAIPAAPSVGDRVRLSVWYEHMWLLRVDVNCGCVDSALCLCRNICHMWGTLCGSLGCVLVNFLIAVTKYLNKAA